MASQLRLPNTVIRNVKNPTAEDLDEMASMLMFKDDPVTTSSCGGDPSLLHAYHRCMMGASAVGGDLFVAYHNDGEKDKPIGVVAFFGPGKDIMTTEEQRAQGYDEFMKVAHSDWLQNVFFPQYVSATHGLMESGFKESVWSVNLLAVAPEYRRKGVARALMAAGEALAKKDGLPVVLEAQDPSALTMYLKISYRIIGQATLDLQPLANEMLLSIVQKDPADME